MFDLHKEFGEIVKGLPYFGISLEIRSEIENCIWAAVSDLKEECKVIIRGGGCHTEELLRVFGKKYENKVEILAIVDDGMQGEKIEKISVISREQAEKLEYDMVIISSFSYDKEMRLDYDESKVRVWSLYDELQKRGYHLEAPFYYYHERNYEIPLYYMKVYDSEKTKRNLEMVIDSLLVLKDFKTLFRYIQEYIEKGFDTQNIYASLESDLNNLYSKIKKEISDRGAKDIVMFWIDAVPYTQLSWLPYVYSKRDSSYFFEKAYSTTPYTHPTMHTLLQGALRIEDFYVTQKEIDDINSEVIQDLQMAGYEFLYIGYCGNKHVAEKFRIKNSSVNAEMAKMVSACKIYWELLCQLTSSSKPLYCIAHSIVETHEPYIALSLWKKRSYKMSQILKWEQNKKSYEYLNEQLEFYSGFLSDDMTKIYMSDHGNVFSLDTWKFTEQRVHPFFLIEGGSIPARREKGIFSYANFRQVVKYLLSNQEEYLLQAITDYALIEDVDKYNIKAVNSLLQNKIVEYGLSFRGVVTDTDKYVKLSNGKEFYFQLPAEWENLINDERFSDRIFRLSEIAGDIFLDINQYPEFVHSRRLYAKK